MNLDLRSLVNASLNHSNNDSNTSLDSNRLNNNSFDLTSSSSTINNKSAINNSTSFGNKRKREFWFAVPRHRVDNIYHFLLHWTPEKYAKV